MVMRKIAWPSLLLLLLLIGVSSCTPRGEVEKLRQVEEIIENDPVTAGSLLNYVKVTSLKGEGRARYALLRTQADYKNYVPLASDSLICIATNHYGTKTPSEHAALAQYYLGCTYKDMGQDLDAIDAFLRAISLFPDTTNKYYAYSQLELGKLYLNHDMIKKSLDAFKGYHNYGDYSNDSINLGYAEYFLGRSYSGLNESEEAEQSFLKVINNTVIEDSYKLASLFQLAKMNFYLNKDVNKADECITKYINRSLDKNGIAAAYLLKGDICREMMKPDSAYYFYLKSMNSLNPDLPTQCMLYKGLAELSPLLHHYDSITFFISKYTELIDSLYADLHRSEINDLVANHTIELHDREMEEHHSRLIMWVIILFLLMIVMGVIFLLYNNKRHQAAILKYQQLQQQINNEEIERKTCEDALDESAGTNITDDDCEAAADDAASAAASPELTTADYMTNLINLARDEYVHSEWPKYIAGCQDKIKAGEVMKGEKSKAFLSYLNVLFSDIFVRITADNDGLSQTDLEYCAMVMLLFKTDQMAFCAHGSNHSFHCRHAKMRDRLTDEWYMLIFGKSKVKASAALTD